MIESFLESWDLFWPTYTTGWLVAALLSLVGVFVVARDQIFLGAAVSQASALGIALALAAAALPIAEEVHWLESESFPAVMAILFAVGASVATARGGIHRHESHEAVTGWVFLAGSSLSILVVSSSPRGVEEVHNLLFSTIIGASEGDVGRFAVLLAVTSTVVIALRRRLLLLTIDPPMALAVGVRVGVWELVTSAWFGLTIGLAIRVSGLLFTFGCLVLPSLIARTVCREVLPMVLVAPSIAVAACSIAFVLAHHYDFPPAQVAISLLALSLAAVWVLRAGLRRARSA